MKKKKVTFTSLFLFLLVLMMSLSSSLVYAKEWNTFDVYSTATNRPINNTRYRKNSGVKMQSMSNSGRVGFVTITGNVNMRVKRNAKSGWIMRRNTTYWYYIPTRLKEGCQIRLYLYPPSRLSGGYGYGENPGYGWIASGRCHFSRYGRKFANMIQIDGLGDVYWKYS